MQVGGVMGLKQKKYEKPQIIKQAKMTFPIDILEANNGCVCKQCSSCHSCR